ncbi:MAG TPA: hypothetical protein VI407_00630, partial [Erythrobacter sp.]
MNPRTLVAPLALATGLLAAPAFAGETDAEVEAEAVVAEEAQPATPAPAAPRPFAFAKPVFDETWATIGLGIGMVPSYAGSDDYIAFPLPLIAGRVGGVGIAPN